MLPYCYAHRAFNSSVAILNTKARNLSTRSPYGHTGGRHTAIPEARAQCTTREVLRQAPTRRSMLPRQIYRVSFGPCRGPATSLLWTAMISVPSPLTRIACAKHHHGARQTYPTASRCGASQYAAERMRSGRCCSLLSPLRRPSSLPCILRPNTSRRSNICPYEIEIDPNRLWRPILLPPLQPGVGTCPDRHYRDQKCRMRW
jgi:hypothetical protein